MRSHSVLSSSSNGGIRPTSFYRTKRRDYLLPFLAAGLVLVGSFRMVGFSDLGIAENVSKFQISFGFVALGYVLSWHFAKRLTWLMLLVAAVARIAMLPIEPGDLFERRMWDSKILAAEHNPYELSPDAEALIAFRGEGWDEVLDKGSPSRYLPGLLWVYGVAEEFGHSDDWFKTLLIVVDLALCLLFALRFGADRAALYAWNPLVIYAVGGLGVDYSLYLLPFVGGYLIWDFWIDQKGGVSVIKASGGIGSALGQMVCVAALLMGVGAAMNVLMLPSVLWMTWHILKRSGIRAGMVALVFGGAPLVLSLMWASISLNVDLAKVVAPEFGLGERGISLIPSIVGFMAGGVVSPLFFLALLGVGTVWLLHTCESLERFMSFYLVWTLALATSVYPWSVMLLAIVGVGKGNYVFRVASLSVFAYFGAYRLGGDTQVWTVPWILQVLIWLPVLIAACHYTVGSRSKHGFYVNHF